MSKNPNLESDGEDRWDDYPTENAHLYLRPYCWRNGHDWVNDGFYGDGKECYRCSKWDPGRDPFDDDELQAFFIGTMVGILAAAVGVAFLVVNGLV